MLILILGESKLVRLKKIAIVFVGIVLLLFLSVFVSMNKFDTKNPFMSGTGLLKIMFTEVDIVKIQEYPQVYIAKPKNAQQALINFMEKRGYYYLENERMASTLVFENEVSKNYVDFSVNRYYSKWTFRE